MADLEATLRERLGDRRMWLCLAAGAARSFGGHAGYNDDPSSRYESDDRVPNTKHLREGDVVLVWDKVAAVGVSIIDRIDQSSAMKTLYKCPRCLTTSIKRRSNRRPLYRCQTGCGFEFDEPQAEVVPVRTYSTFHEPGWIPLDGAALLAAELRPLCISPDSQHSIRELHRARTVQALGPLLLQSVKLARTDFGWEGVRHGHRERTVRVRIGQAEFRTALLRDFGASCVVSGPAPQEALEAAHLYSYAKVGQHREHGGLLMRRDLHRLFDEGLIGVEPDTWRLRMREPAFASESYRGLEGSPLASRLKDAHKFWLKEHWAQHDLAQRAVAAR
ncbi:HNH endonuclease signature motif containing protein [Agrococcus sp. Marseille-Q4369]|uniref:HNH endonuclease signature motif containing protein n=1 Tax=Agrococcus sp. Marseille-Q4369 TaxID=2810513 RepID=UPI001B8B1187|nr:HNH endonuclease signature motif containing protein [Agrococcus sp. Marseille-Q4369]QUW18225.1 HNH endonuclease [Agrococcus sp. Marseille-Q4369]